MVFIDLIWVLYGSGMEVAWVLYRLGAWVWCGFCLGLVLVWYMGLVGVWYKFCIEFVWFVYGFAWYRFDMGFV